MKNKVLIGLFVVALIAIDYLVIRQRVTEPPKVNLPIYTAATISSYSGENGKMPILIALDGLVYDVSAGAADFYAPGESYHYLVGRDSSTLLHVFGGDIIKKKYPVVGVYKP